MIRRLLLGLLLLVLALVLAVVVNTWRKGSRQLEVAPVTPVAVDGAAVARRLAGAIAFRTMASLDDAEASADEFRKLHAYLAEQFPKVHAALKREVVGHSLLFTWEGSDPKARPIALMAHQDVVPIAPGTEKAWKVAPFGGLIEDGFIWGRGAWDNKGNLFGQMEAVELLLSRGFKPRQTIYFVMGSDEEVGGLRGARRVAELLTSRGVKLDFVLDEGLLITDGVLTGLSQPAALVGVAEKGYGTYFLSLDATPGHSSMPPKQTAIGVMAAGLSRLESQQFPAAIKGVAAEMFDTLAPEMGGFSRVALSNLWLFGPLVRAQLEKSPSTDAMLRTTTALTIFNAGNKDNVIPGHADAAVNFRLLPGDRLADVEAHVEKAMAHDAVKLQRSPSNAEPSPVSPTSASGYQAINRTVREIFPGTLVAPGLMIAGTDSRHFTPLSDNIYRFSPVRARPEDLPRFHGTNERISVANLVEVVQFYHQLLRNVAAPGR